MRPFFNKSIVELETLFDTQHGDIAFLKTLKEELQCRHVRRAKDLQARVQQTLEAGAKSTQTEHKPLRSIEQSPTVTVPLKPTLKEENIVLAAEKHKPVTDMSPPLKFKPLIDNPPPVTNKPDDILLAWTAMEVLSPPSFRRPEDLTGGDKFKIANFKDDVLPWDNDGEKSKQNYRLYYQIILGTVDMELAISALLNVYTDSRAELPQARGDAVLATILVDRKGRVIDRDSISISSFGWGIPLALSRRLCDLGQWSETEKKLVSALADQIITEDDEGNSQPLTVEVLSRSCFWLINEIGLDKYFVKPPAFAIRAYQYYKLQDPPESILLNSFYLDDLARARTLLGEDKATPNLKRYLGITKQQTRLNLMTDKQAIAEALEPKKFPLGSWPAPGRHPLVMLQQCAVNLAMNDLKQDGILAVNGPPGTGKTTLLRDVIAAIITERAQILASYENPEDAFTHTGQKLRRGNSFIHLYALDEKIRGYEVIISSSNNKAVENVSAELPGICAIAEDATSLRYFKTVSDALLKDDTWGTIAAVLGNAKNRSEFSRTFWWDVDYGLQRYFQQACGNIQLITEQTENGTIQRLPIVLERENPPKDHDEAMRRWKTTKKRFKTMLASTTKSLSELQTAYDLQQAIQERYTINAELNSELAKLIQLQKNAEAVVQSAEIIHREKENSLVVIDEQRKNSKRSKPGFFSRLFQSVKYRSWSSSHEAMLVALRDAKSNWLQAKSDYEKWQTEKIRLNTEIATLQAAKDKNMSALADEISRHTVIAARYSGLFIDELFFDKSREERQMTAPWLDKNVARQRNDLFETAIALQRAFIDAAAKPIRHNLNALLDNFGTRSLGSVEKDALIPHLWSTLFLVVPAVSTTFASVSRMFCNIGPQGLGWLLIDEAGQALPQAAVGALLRTRKAVVVGDPIQIEPIVVLPDLLTGAICKQFGIDPLIYNPPTASVQTLADSTTAYFGSFETKYGTREVGVPLLVHRRCAEPMFGISNEIAYENLMVQAKAPKSSKILSILGPSRWINVNGRGQDKWCPEEGEVVLTLLHRLKEGGCMPDLYIVTPFVVVQDRMRTLVISSRILDGWVENSSSWVYERIGTVHTVQGREAEAVILLLGAPNAEQRGARTWAGRRPNLLNVAITRAKEASYVVGNINLWKDVNVFLVLHRMLGE